MKISAASVSNISIFKSTRLCKLHFWDCFRSHFKLHPGTTDDSLDTMCIHCGILNEHAVALGRHLESQHGTNANCICIICGKKGLKSELEMKSHMELHQLMLKLHLTCRLFYCSGCEKIFESKALLRKHLHHAHSKSTTETNIEFSLPNSEISADDNIITVPVPTKSETCIEKNFISKCTQTDIESSESQLPDSGVFVDYNMTTAKYFIVEEVRDGDDIMNNCGPVCTQTDIVSSESQLPDSDVCADYDMTTAENFIVEDVREPADIVINVEKNCSLWKCPLCPNFSCKYGLKQRSHNLNMHKDSFKSFCRFCGFLNNSKGRLRAHEARCQFHLALKRDPSGVEYVTLWRRTAKNIVQKNSMLEECHSSFTDIFLLSKKSKKALLNYVPLVTLKRWLVK